MQRSRTIRVGDSVIRKDAPNVEGEVLAVEGGTARVRWTLHTHTRTRLDALVPVGRRVRRHGSPVRAAILAVIALVVTCLHAQVGAMQGLGARSADAPPTLDYSQRAALFLLRAHQFELQQQRESLRAQLNNLDGQLVSITESEKAIAAEYAQQHPAWHLDDKFQPARNAASPARHAQAAGQK